jgi:SnoaL-like protein
MTILIEGATAAWNTTRPTAAKHTAKIMAAVACLSTIIGPLTGCSSNPDQSPSNDDPKSYTQHYQQALERTDLAVPASQQSVDKFIAVFTHLTAENLPEKIEIAYADAFYFSDTLHVINRRDALIDYLAETAKRVDDIQVTILSVSHDNVDVYVRWKMETKLSVWGKDIDAHSVGISQLRFNQQGKVILHQDFWDSSEGLLSHLPFIGGVVRWTRNQL